MDKDKELELVCEKAKSIEYESNAIFFKVKYKYELRQVL